MDDISPRAKIDDVARLAGVSTKTVSRVLNKEPNVRDVTRARVKEAISALNYMPDFSARSLAGQKSYLIAMFYDTASQGYLAGFQAGALAQCAEYGYHLIVERCELDTLSPGARVAGIASRLRVDGVVLLPPLSNHQHVLDGLGQTNIPFVQIVPADTSKAKLYLDMDDTSAAFELTRHLVTLGHRRIAHIKGHPAHGASVQRYHGYCKALKAANIACDRKLIGEGLFTLASGEAVMASLMDQAEPPTAIFAANDDMAAGAIKYAREHGLSVPADLSIVGFDDADIARVAHPALTTIRQPVDAMARGAIDLLIDAIRTGSGKPAAEPQPQRHFKFEFIERKSTAPPKR